MVIRVWQQAIGSLKKNPIILLPFFIVGLFDAISLFLIYLAPQPPFSAVLAPPIRAFWGEQYLHYPLNLVLIPRLFRFAHIITVAIIGVLMTGLAIGLLNQVKNRNKPQILLNFIRALSRYFALLTIWLVMFGLATLAYKIPGFFVPFNNKAIIYTVFYFSFLLTIFIQAIFIYCLPAVLIEKRGVVSAIKRGLSFSKQHFPSTLILVGIPALFYLPIIILRGQAAVLMNRFFPEIVLIILGAGIVISVLIDCLVTCSTTILFLNQRKG